MRYRVSIGIIVIATAIATTTALSSPLFSTLSAIADIIRTYGTDGSDGRSGRDGRDGTTGNSRTIRADGSSQEVYTVGTDGQDGETGEIGQRSSFCRSQPYDVEYDLQAPDGGNGGNGGDGGDGGNGGDVTIYYTNLADLRLITVSAEGGQPGRGGRGALGGRGCECEDRRWRVKTCDGDDCEEERYTCRDGDDGRFGYNGRDGRVGQPGQLWLVNQAEPLLPETPTQIQTLAAFAQQPIQLSKNLWREQSGASLLLATNSIVADVYHDYIGRVEGQAQILWEAPRLPTDFSTTSTTAVIDDTGNVQFEFPESVWLTGNQDQVDGLTTYTITGAVRANEATHLATGQMDGQGSELTLAVIDLARESDYLTTQFELLYRTAAGNPHDDRRLRYQTRYEGEIPASLVTRDNNRFVLSLGELPIESRYLRTGIHVRAELRITRSLGNNSATKTLDWQGQL
ncbi:MAG: collagen-like protein [Cyanobacteria bacterium P01_F01_bin.86]